MCVCVASVQECKSGFVGGEGVCVGGEGRGRKCESGHGGWRECDTKGL